METFWGIDPNADPVVRQVEYEKDAAKFYGEGTDVDLGKKKQSREEAIRVFFAVGDKAPCMPVL